MVLIYGTKFEQCLLNLKDLIASKASFISISQEID